MQKKIVIETATNGADDTVTNLYIWFDSDLEDEDDINDLMDDMLEKFIYNDNGLYYRAKRWFAKEDENIKVKFDFDEDWRDY